MDEQFDGDCDFLGFEGGADGFFAAKVGFADDLPADVVGEMVEDGVDVAVGKGDVQVSEDEFPGGVAAVGVDGEFGRGESALCAVNRR